VQHLVRLGLGDRVEGADQVHAVDRSLADHAMRVALGVHHDQRATDRRGAGPDLALQPVVAPDVSLVGSEDDDGVFELARLFECFHDLADAVIDGQDRFGLLLGPEVKRLASEDRIAVLILFPSAALHVHDSLVQRMAYLPSLIHCSAVPRWL